MTVQEARLLACAVIALGCGRTTIGFLHAGEGDKAATGGVGGSGPAGAGAGRAGTVNPPDPAGGAGMGGGSAVCTPRIGGPSPADGARDVPTEADVTLTVECAEGVEPNWGALMLSVSAHERDVTGRVERDFYLKRVGFYPDRPLSLAATFDAKLVDTSTGVALFAWRFTTRDGVWRDSTVVPGSDLALTVDDADRAVLFLSTANRDEVSTARYRAAERVWDAPLAFPRRALSPVAKFDSQGGLTLAWQEYAAGQPSVWAARTGSDDVLSEPVELRATDALYARLEAAAFRSDGTGLVAWSDNPTSTGYRTRLFVTPFDGTAAGESTLLARETGIEDMRVAVEPDGGAWVVWQETLPTGDTIVAEHRSPEGFEQAEVLGSGRVRNPRVAVGGGRAIFLFAEFSPDERVTRLRARTFDGRSGWGTIETLDAIGDRAATTDYSDVTYPQLAMDERGNALALWKTSVSYVSGMLGASTSYGHRAELRVQRYDALEGWAPNHVRLGSVAETGEDRLPNDPCVAFDAYGNALVVWSEGRELSTAMAARFLYDSGWVGTVALSAPRDGSAGPRIALDAHGRGFSAWHVEAPSGSEYETLVWRFSDE